MKTVRFVRRGVTKEVKVGFSWTVFFFGAITLFYRGMVVHALCNMLINLVSYGLLGWVYSFFANKLYALKLYDEGWVVYPEDTVAAFEAWGIDK